MAVSTVSPKFVALLDADCNVMEMVPLTVKDASNPFKSGSTGYFASSKLALRNTAGEVTKHQVSASFVEVNGANDELAAVAQGIRNRKAELAVRIKELQSQARNLA